MAGRLWRPAPSRPYKARAKATTSAMMAAVRSRDNKAEVSLRRILWRKGYRYRLYDHRLPGKPDLTFSRFCIVVFVDGDFWHGRGIVEDGLTAFRRTLRTKRQDWWVAKIKGNVDRDRHVTRTLRVMGWRVIRFWETDVLRDPSRAARTVDTVLRSRARRRI